MLHRLACLLFICLTIVTSEFSHSATHSPTKPTLHTNRQTLMESRRISSSNHTNRKEIAFVDEDFDIPPDKELEPRWKIMDLDGDGIEVGTNSSPLVSTEEGSGLDMIPEVSTTTTSSSNVKPEQLQRTTAEEKLTTSVQDTTDFEGSGEDTPEQSTAPGTSTMKPNSSILKVCLNSTCDSKDVTILPGISKTVPEGTNLTLSCVLVNSTAQGILKWYKHVHNGTDEPLVDESNEVHHLILNIPQTRLPHSGIYLCLRYTEYSCCHREMYVTVYEVPNYRYHLIVIGIVTAISLFTCVLLVICRNYKVRKYEEQLELQNMEKQLML